MDRHEVWMTGYLKGLVGATIVEAGVGADDADGEGFPYFVIEKDGERTTVEVSQDPEGNGPGFLFGLPDVQFKGGKLVDSTGKAI